MVFLEKRGELLAHAQPLDSRSACERLAGEGFTILHDYVVHSDMQFTAFGRHDLSAFQEADQCTMVKKGLDGNYRIRVIKGVQEAEGTWKRLKHNSEGIPKELS